MGEYNEQAIQMALAFLQTLDSGIFTISKLQAYLNVGFITVGKIVDELEERGYIKPAPYYGIGMLEVVR